jgi:peptide/nickel transport system substrate-binding protein
MKIPSLAAAAAALVLALGAPADARTVRWAAAGDPNTMDPHSQNLGTVTMVLQQIYDMLIARNADLTLRPGLATSWEQVEPTRWRFVLRQGVRFHEGQAFNADDVVFSVHRALQRTSNYGIFVDTVTRAERVNAFTVDIVTRVPDPILPNKLASLMIMSRDWAEQHNAIRPQNTAQREEMHTVRATNGTGAYRLSVREPDVRTVMVRHDAWYGWQEENPGNITEIDFRPIRSDATRIAALLSGEVDFVLDPPLQDLARLRANQNVRVIEGPEVRTIFFAFDTAREELLYSSVRGRNPFRDLRVRQALYHAIDSNAIQRAVMRGQAVVTGTFFPEQVNGYSREEDVRLPFNADRARALLAEAGYPQGFEVTLDCPNNRYINDEEICQAVAAMWTRVGVRTTLNAMPLGPFFAKIQRRETSVYLLGWGVPTLDALYSFQSLLATPGRNPADCIWNYGGYSNARMDELIEIMKTQSGQPRMAAIREALRIYREDVPHIPLHHQMIPWATRSSLTIPHSANNQPYFRWARMN